MPSIPIADPDQAGSMTRFVSGVRHLFWGIRSCLTNGSLFLLSLVVIATNLVVYAILLGIGVYYSGEISLWIADQLPDWINDQQWAKIVLQIVLVIVWTLISIFVAIGISSALTGPLLDMLSERTEKMLTGDVNPPPLTVGGFVREVIATLTMAARGIGLALLVTILVGWIPLLGPVAALCVTALFVAHNYVQPTAARHGLKPRDRMRMLTQNKVLMLGFGLPASLFPFLLVPILTPALVVGGTRMFLSLVGSQRVPNIATNEQLRALV